MEHSTSYRPSKHDLRAATNLAHAITGRCSAARRIVRQCRGSRNAAAFLIEVRQRAIALTSSHSATAPAPSPSLVEATRVTDPALNAYLARWLGLRAEERQAAWRALCGQPFRADLLRTAVVNLSGNLETAAPTPNREPGALEPNLPSEQDIP